MISKLKIDLRESHGILTVSVNSPDVFATFSADEVELIDHRSQAAAEDVEPSAAGERDPVTGPA